LGVCGAAEAAPFQNTTFSAACKARIDFAAADVRAEQAADKSLFAG
jgi:hypothetical protein